MKEVTERRRKKTTFSGKQVFLEHDAEAKVKKN